MKCAYALEEFSKILVAVDCEESQWCILMHKYFLEPFRFSGFSTQTKGGAEYRASLMGGIAYKLWNDESELSITSLLN